MIKRETRTTGEAEIVVYICDNCVKEMPGAAIRVYYPFGHINDSLDGPSHFCCDKCLVAFEDKLVKKYGPWKSTKPEAGKKVRSSSEWRKSRGVTPRPKARRVVRRIRRRTTRGNK